MIAPLLVLLLAPAPRVDLVDEVFDIPPAEWRFVELSLKQEPVTVWCEFESSGPNRAVRVALLRREDVERMREERAHGILVVRGPAERGVMHYVVTGPGDFAVLVDNRTGDRRAARVHLKIWLDFSPPAEPNVRYVSPRRRTVVVVLSLTVFLGIVLFSVRKLRRGGK